MCDCDVLYKLILDLDILRAYISNFIAILKNFFVIVQGVSQKTLHSWENQTLGTSYSETTNQLGLKLWQQGVLMRTPCCQSLRSNRLVV